MTKPERELVLTMANVLLALLPRSPGNADLIQHVSEAREAMLDDEIATARTARYTASELGLG